MVNNERYAYFQSVPLEWKKGIYEDMIRGFGMTFGI